MFLLWHPWLTATNLSYSFPLLETSATALCGTTGIYRFFAYTEPLDSADTRGCAVPECRQERLIRSQSGALFREFDRRIPTLAGNSRPQSRPSSAAFQRQAPFVEPSWTHFWNMFQHLTTWTTLFRCSKAVSNLRQVEHVQSRYYNMLFDIVWYCSVFGFWSIGVNSTETTAGNCWPWFGLWVAFAYTSH